MTVGGTIYYGMDANYVRRVNQFKGLSKEKKRDKLMNYALKNGLTLKKTGKYKGNEILYSFYLRGQKTKHGESFTINQGYQKFLGE